MALFLLALTTFLVAAAAAQAASPKPVQAPTTFRVHVLPTSDVAGNTYRYDRQIAVTVLGGLAKRLAAYGAAGRVWLGPEGWSGRASVGADGSTLVCLSPGRHLPADAGSPSGQYIEYSDNGGCAGCGLAEAAIYFPGIRSLTGRESVSGARNAPAGLRVRAIAPGLVQFTLPDRNGLAERGIAAWSGPPEDSFSLARFVLPRWQADLVQLLEDIYARGAGRRARVR